MEHSKTPWKVRHMEQFHSAGEFGVEIVDADSNVIADNQTYYPAAISEHNARRIVACVNACAGMPQDDVEDLAKVGVMELTVYADDMRRQRDELLAVLERIIGACNACVADDNKSLVDEFTAEMEDEARAVIQKVRGGEC